MKLGIIESVRAQWSIAANLINQPISGYVAIVLSVFMKARLVVFVVGQFYCSLSYALRPWKGA